MEIGKTNLAEKRRYKVEEINYKVSEVFENIKIKEEKIIVGNLITNKNIISYNSMFVIGNIDCKYLSVNGDLFCTGTIKCEELDVEGDLYHVYKIYSSEKINVNGKRIVLKKDFFSNIDNKLEKDEIKSDLILDLKKYREEKEKIIKKEIESLSDLESLVNKFKSLGINMPECNRYTEFIKFLILLSETNNINIIEFLKWICISKKVPDYIKNIDYVRMELELVEDIDIKRLEFDITSNEKKLELARYIYGAKEWLKEKNYYDYFLDLTFGMDKKDMTEEDCKEKVNELENNIKINEKETSTQENKIDQINTSYDKNVKKNIEIDNENIVDESYIRQDYKIIDKYIGTNTNYNTIEMLFYKARSMMGINEIRIIKKSRIKGYKTVLIVSKLVGGKSYDRIKDLENYIDKSIIGEEVKIIVYTPEKKSIISSILGIKEENVIIDEKSRKVDIVLEKSRKSILNCDKEKIIISEILPYYKIQFFYSSDENTKSDSNIGNENNNDIEIIEEKNKIYNKENEVIESSKEVEDAVDSILNIFFK